jgi:hypothetical protein
MSEARSEPSKKPLTEAQKTEATALYRAGVATADEIATKLKVSVHTLRSYFARKGIKKGEKEKEVASKKEALVQQALALDPAILTRRIFDTKNETYRYIEMIRKLAAKTIVDCQQKGQPLGMIQNDMKALREAASTIKTCREEAFAVLGVRLDEVEDENLPDLHITGLTDDQIEDLQMQSVGEEIPDLPDPTVGEPDE